MASGVKCPSCSQKINLSSLQTGQVIVCPMCKQSFEVPSRESPTPVVHVSRPSNAVAQSSPASERRDFPREPPPRVPVGSNLNLDEPNSFPRIAGCGCVIVVLVVAIAIMVIASRMMAQ